MFPILDFRMRSGGTVQVCRLRLPAQTSIPQARWDHDTVACMPPPLAPRAHRLPASPSSSTGGRREETSFRTEPPSTPHRPTSWGC